MFGAMVTAVAGQVPAVFRRHRYPLDHVDHGPVRIEHHEVALAEIGAHLETEQPAVERHGHRDVGHAEIGERSGHHA